MNFIARRHHPRRKGAANFKNALKKSYPGPGVMKQTGPFWALSFQSGSFIKTNKLYSELGKPRSKWQSEDYKSTIFPGKYTYYLHSMVNRA